MKPIAWCKSWVFFRSTVSWLVFPTWGMHVTHRGFISTAKHTFSGKHSAGLNWVRMVLANFPDISNMLWIVAVHEGKEKQFEIKHVCVSFGAPPMCQDDHCGFVVLSWQKMSILSMCLMRFWMHRSECCFARGWLRERELPTDAGRVLSTLSKIISICLA